MIQAENLPSKIINKNILVGSCVKLYESVDLQKVKNEIKSIPNDLWRNERNRAHDDALSVFLKGYPARERRPSEEREIFSSLPYTKKLISNLGYGELANALLAKLKPKGIILLHTDGSPSVANTEPSYFSTTVRLHIPIKSNSKVLFCCNDRFYRMEEGCIYAINNSAKHGVLNDDESEERIHLIFDIIPNSEFIDILKSHKQETGFANHDLFNRLKNASNLI